MRTVTLTIEQLAIISNGLESLRNGWETTKEFTEEQKTRVLSNIKEVELSLKNQTRL